MIARVKDDQYLNIFEVTWLIASAEFFIAMSWLGLYDMENDTWHRRKIFWYFVGFLAALPIILAGIFGTAAALKYLL